MSKAEWEGTEKPTNYREAGSGWDAITNPFTMMLSQLYNDPSKDKPGETTYRFKGDVRRSWYGGQPGLTPPPPSTGKFSFTAGGVGGNSSAPTASWSGGGQLASIPQNTATTGLGLSPSSLGLTGTGGATGSITTAGSAPTWMKYGKAGLSAYSAYQSAAENKKASEYASQSRTTTSTPYMSNMLNPFIPYILQEALNIYSSRVKNATGRQVGDFNPLMAILGQYFNQYTR